MNISVQRNFYSKYAATKNTNIVSCVMILQKQKGTFIKSGNGTFKMWTLSVNLIGQEADPNLTSKNMSSDTQMRELVLYYLQWEHRHLATTGIIHIMNTEYLPSYSILGPSYLLDTIKNYPLKISNTSFLACALIICRVYFRKVCSGYSWKVNNI